MHESSFVRLVKIESPGAGDSDKESRAHFEYIDSNGETRRLLTAKGELVDSFALEAGELQARLDTLRECSVVPDETLRAIQSIRQPL